MNKKNKPDIRGDVYSTDPSFGFENNDNEAAETLPPAQQKLRIKLENQIEIVKWIEKNS